MVMLLWLCASLPWLTVAMRADRLRQLRQETVDMFYHGFSNYMKHAFPEDEVCQDGAYRKDLQTVQSANILVLVTSYGRSLAAP